MRVPWTQADLDALDAAYKSGAESARTADGRSVTYRSVEEYFALRRIMQGEIDAAVGTTPSKLVRVGFQSGVR